jgi:hypothetical protein
MRAPLGTIGIALASLSMLAAVGLVACFDLLHSTDDIETACAIDASHPGCPHASTQVDVEDTDFCAWAPARAQTSAVHACAWLGACETPMGNNAFGPCYFRALMAYDCQANPNHPVRNEAHRLWDCLQRVKSCGDVDECVFAGPPPTCEGPGFFTGCATSTSIRVSCQDGGTTPPPRAFGENCALWGQTCALGASNSVCAGEATGVSCTDRSCDQVTHKIHLCAPLVDGGPAIDLGVDCTSNGAQSCAVLPSRDMPFWPACLPVSGAGEGDAGACAPSMSATCDDAGRAHSCLAGVGESLDCARLLGSPAGCNPGAIEPEFDWTGPCAVVPPECTSDSCDGNTLRSCERGHTFFADCSSTGLGGCELVTADPGGAPRAACAAPAR